jgi:hypothetical protein
MSAKCQTATYAVQQFTDDSVPSGRTGKGGHSCRQTNRANNSGGILNGTWSVSKLGVKPRGKNVDRPAVGVIGGIGDELVIEGKARPLVKAVGVIHLKDLLGLVIERTVADQYSEPSRGEVGARLGREAIKYAGHADFVVGAAPGCPFKLGAD